MKYFYATAIALFLAVFSLPAQTELAFPSFNMNLQKQMFPPPPPLGTGGQGAFYNDIWGYTDPDTGKEYAIFGSLENVYIYDISDSENGNVTEVFEYNVTVSIPNPLGGTIDLTRDLFSAANPPSLWRDFKTYSHYAYGVVDLGSSVSEEEGLLIFDLSDISNGVVTLANQLSSPAATGPYFQRSHNIYIDVQNGLLYAVGVRGDNDIKVYDVAADPANPPLVQEINFDAFASQDLTDNGFNGYVHDIFVEDNIAYCSHINSGEWAIWNLNGMRNNPNFEPKLVAWVDSGDLQHSSWPTKDRTAFVFCEETADEPIGFVDISGIDFDNPMGNEIEITYLFRDPLLEPDGNTDNIAHNAFIRGNYLYIAYYEDGVQVFDIENSDFSDSNPQASSTVERDPPPRVAYLDTSPETQPGAGVPYGTRLPTWNNWGTYPYFSSNKIIASDTEYGLFVMSIIDGDDGFQSGDALSVDLAAFSAKTEQNRVRLNWLTESELEHAGFTIERSANGVDGWELVKEVKAKGNVAGQMEYMEYDENPLQGTNYYRLGMTSLDAKTAFSNVVLVEFASDQMTVNVTPTLVNTKDMVSIQVMDAVVNTLEVRVIDMQGKVVLQQQISTADGSHFELLVNDLPKGNYVLALDGGNVKATERISVVK